MAKQKIEIEGEFSTDEEGDVRFAGLYVLHWNGAPYSCRPEPLIKAARAWLEEQKNTVEVTVKVRFNRDKYGSVYANGGRVIYLDGPCFGGHTYPEIAEAASEWARRNPA
jgi:hypothetical protein